MVSVLYILTSWNGLHFGSEGVASMLMPACGWNSVSYQEDHSVPCLKSRLLNKTNDLTVLSFLPVGHIQAGLESPNIQRMRGTEVEHSGTDVRAWTENESFLSVFWRGICHISELKSLYPSACWGELNSVIIEIDMLCLAGNINTSCHQQTANAPPWVLKWNGSTCLLQRDSAARL